MTVIELRNELNQVGRSLQAIAGGTANAGS